MVYKCNELHVNQTMLYLICYVRSRMKSCTISTFLFPLLSLSLAPFLHVSLFLPLSLSLASFPSLCLFFSVICYNAMAWHVQFCPVCHIRVDSLRLYLYLIVHLTGTLCGLISLHRQELKITNHTAGVGLKFRHWVVFRSCVDSWLCVFMCVVAIVCVCVYPRRKL